MIIILCRFYAAGSLQFSAKICKSKFESEQFFLPMETYFASLVCNSGILRAVIEK